MPNTTDRPTRVEICCANHDHSLGLDAVSFDDHTPSPCKYGVKEAIIELTDEEIAEREAMAAQAQADRVAREAAADALAALKASAKAKLIAGAPLTPEEADTLVL